MQYKQSLRQAIKKQRLALSPEQCHDASQSICQTIIQQPLFQQANTVACYLAVNNEVTVQTLIDETLNQNKSCLLPVINPLNPQELLFAPYQRHDTLYPNCYNILEPLDRLAETIPNHLIDLVITPLIAFDEQLNRLGMGGGFYDRSFSFLAQPETATTVLLGAAYEFQKVACLTPEAWDIPLQVVVTEQRIYKA